MPMPMSYEASTGLFLDYEKAIQAKGDGSWLDNWHPLSPLFKRFREGLVRDLGSSLLAMVSSIIYDGEWKWPRQRNGAIIYIREHAPSEFKPDMEISDCVIWSPALIALSRLATKARLNGWGMAVDLTCCVIKKLNPMINFSGQI
ncbi:hypothetical protein Acr_04g0005180 [Actinidia rufa]|uniref:Uncharacterized protein n=1 Tax=Actinidia rufa TaxID=165716 RepID=A0A7J0EHC8_9ERIC|nr:hypothetical protein Acr_04g0005180 [Actinidia rufa]